ncbi:PREDICTED: putative nuclease HARBI1 [Cyphomyrmex costatus]|uniref:putative nuclease HARBI1 n=1 Tax=Cyphomyrmex costatus TaxID=456900 RepID=UPI0008523612|nr:PREDICTED: putative nuclease HARBI1 [Cyphomyrmex costatus]
MEKDTFCRHFRLCPETCEQLIDGFQQSDFFPKNEMHGGKSAVSAEKHILSFLWFAGNKSSMRDVADRFDIAISTCETILSRVMNYLLSIATDIIKFPNNDKEKDELAYHFSKMSGFPNVIGCIDGSYINIRTPKHKIRSTYANRYDKTSLTLQGICDDKKRFIDVFTGVIGKFHDSRTFTLSFISKNISDICQNGKYHLLGDSAYPLREYLLTPHKDYGNLTQSQRIYNKKLCGTRVCIENTFGLLKSRFQLINELNDEMFNIDDFQVMGEMELKRRGEQKRNEICDTISQ